MPGGGFDLEKISSLMAPFERGNSDPYVSRDGTGLGLAITHSLIELHNGSLDIKSTLGKGTTVMVTLPNGGP